MCINGVFVRLENNDYLAIQSKKFFPDAYAHTQEDLELEANEWDTEERNLLQMREELERGKMHAAVSYETVLTHSRHSIH